MLWSATVVVRHTRRTITRFDAAAPHRELLEPRSRPDPVAVLAPRTVIEPLSIFRIKNMEPGSPGTSTRRNPGDPDLSHPHLPRTPVPPSAIRHPTKPGIQKARRKKGDKRQPDRFQPARHPGVRSQRRTDLAGGPRGIPLSLRVSHRIIRQQPGSGA